MDSVKFRPNLLMSARFLINNEPVSPHPYQRFRQPEYEFLVFLYITLTLQLHITTSYYTVAVFPQGCACGSDVAVLATWQQNPGRAWSWPAFSGCGAWA